MNPLIHLNEMRERVAAKLFGEDWIDDLTDDEYELLNAYAPFLRDVRRTDGATIKLNHIKHVPENQRTKLDRALGRQARMDAQFTTVDSWIQDHNLPVDPRRPASRSAFNKLLRVEFPKANQPENPPRRRGPKATILPRLMGMMRAELASGALTEDQLFDMADKKMAFRFQAKRERCREARDRVLRERSEK